MTYDPKHELSRDLPVLLQLSNLSVETNPIGDLRTHMQWWAYHLRLYFTARRLEYVPANIDPPTITAFRGDSGWHPFVLMPDFFNPDELCYMNPFDTGFSYNRLAYTDLHDLGYDSRVIDIPVIHYGDVAHLLHDYEDEEQRFRAFLREFLPDFQVNSHFFGAKWDQLSWKTVRESAKTKNSLDLANDMEQHMRHTLRVSEREGELDNVYSVADWAALSTIYFPWELDHSTAYVVQATHMAENGRQSVPCKMFVAETVDGFACKRIFLDNKPMYKPFSLAINAQVWAVKSFMLNRGRRVDHIDLGANFSAAGDYKSVIKHTAEPLYNFRNFKSQGDHDQWLASIPEDRRVSIEWETSNV